MTNHHRWLAFSGSSLHFCLRHARLMPDWHVSLCLIGSSAHSAGGGNMHGGSAAPSASHHGSGSHKSHGHKKRHPDGHTHGHKKKVRAHAVRGREDRDREGGNAGVVLASMIWPSTHHPFHAAAPIRARIDAPPNSDACTPRSPFVCTTGRADIAILSWCSVSRGAASRVGHEDQHVVRGCWSGQRSKFELATPLPRI